MSTYEMFLENNERWRQQKLAAQPDFFRELAAGQTPEVLYIGCSDSRVTVEEITGANPGEMFVHRNIANVIANNDLSAMSVIEYAVGFLGVKHIVVCGHYGCGGVKAAMQPQDLGILNPWLRNIRDVYRLHSDEIKALPQEQQYDRLVELNVEEQCLNVIKTAVLQKHFLRSGFPTVHGWVFDMRNGHLVDLKINFDKKLRDIREIYDLGTNS